MHRHTLSLPEDVLLTVYSKYGFDLRTWLWQRQSGSTEVPCHRKLVVWDGSIYNPAHVLNIQ